MTIRGVHHLLVGKRKPSSLKRAPIYFLVPAVTLSVLVMIFPLVYTVYQSLQDWVIASPVPAQFVGLDNFRELLSNPRVHRAFYRTIYMTVGAVGTQVVFGVGLALVMNRQFFGRGLIRTIAILPIVATPVAISLVFVTMMHPSLGVLNYMLESIGLPPFLWTYSRHTVIPTIIMVETWKWSPFVMLIALAGLSTLPAEPFESARIDGAGSWRIFWSITLPMLLPTIIVAIVLRSIDTLKLFDTIFAMTQGGPGTASETLNIYVFRMAFQYFRMGYASSVVVAFLVIILFVTLLLIKLRRRFSS